MPKERVPKKSRVHKEIQKEGQRDESSAAVINTHSSLGINFNKDFGQHILKNPLIITSMVDKVIDQQ